MPVRITPLSETEIETARPGKKTVRLYDGYGLYLQVEPRGVKLWRYKYHFNGKEKSISFGKYPEVSLQDARLLRSDARLLLDKGVDPSVARKEEKARTDFSEGKLSVRMDIDGTIEIWKGRSVLRMTREEAQFIDDLLTKLLQ